MAREWTTDEREFIRYGTLIGADRADLADMIGRTDEAVRKEIRRQKNDGRLPEDAGTAIPAPATDTSPHDIRTAWTDEETQVLLDHFDDDLDTLAGLIPTRGRSAICKRRSAIRRGALAVGHVAPRLPEESSVPYLFEVGEDRQDDTGDDHDDGQEVPVPRVPQPPKKGLPGLVDFLLGKR